MLAIRALSLVALTAGLVGLLGCGGGPQMGEVEGTIKLKGGKVLDKIHVEFWPQVDGPRSFGITNDQGRFTLMTDDGKRQGAVVGPHKIVLRDVGIMDAKFLGRAGETVDLTKGRKPRISSQYTDAHKTTLKREVTTGKCVIDLDVDP